MNYTIPAGAPNPAPLPGRLPGFFDNPPGADFDGPTTGPLGYAVVYDTTGRQLDRWYEYANGEDYEATLETMNRGAGALVLGPLVRATDGVTPGTPVRVGLYDYAGRLTATADVPADQPAPSPMDLVFVVPRDAIVADDQRAAILKVWIDRVREERHPTAEWLRSGSPDEDRAGHSRHCGTARIGRAAFDVYVTDSLNHVYGVRVDDPNTLVLLGLDQAPWTPDVSRIKALAVRAQQQLHTDVETARNKLGDWVTQTAAELTELVERANNLLRTGAGNGVDRDAVRDQADMVEIIAALLPAWADRGVHPATETNVELVAARLTHLVAELEA